MMKSNKCLILFFVVLLPSLKLSAQDSGQHAVHLIGRATPSSIKLRWGPDSPIAWYYANKYGYTIERVTISINGRVLDEPVRKILNRDPILPAEERDWLQYFDQDDYVGVAAQAIFGESFEVTEEFSTEMMKIINKVKELENRFSFALYAADLSLKAAELSGLYYEDEEIAAGYRYLYRVYANIPPDVLEVDTAFTYIGMEDYRPLPAVRDVRVEFSDRQAMISWNGDVFKKLYNTFWVERSDDGKTFHRITNVPVVNTFKGDEPRTDRMYRLDSLPANYITYHYRVIGINAFGELSPPSDTVSGEGLPVFQYAPAILSHAVSDQGAVRLEWSFPEQGQGLLKSFDLLKQNQQTKALEEVVLGLGPDKRTVSDSRPGTSNYYIIRANDIYDRSTLSFPYLVQTEDSIPPSSPAGLEGYIDTLGHVYLEWLPNAEDDLYGYKLYRSNFLNEPFIQVPGPIITSSGYVDTVHLKTLTETIYYKLVALDNRFNPSAFSDPLELKKPDLVPPSMPVFNTIRADSLGVFISWSGSESEDVMRHLVYRRSDRESSWTLIGDIENPGQEFYYDQEVKHQTAYAYTLLAVDDDGLESTPAIPVTIRWMDPNPYPAVGEMFYYLDKEHKTVTLSWNYDNEAVEKFLVYKGANGSPLTLYKAVDGHTNELIDHFRTSDAYVEYRVMASFRTGEKSGFSEKIKVTF